MAVDGVEDVKIDYAAKKAYVTVEPGTNPEKVVGGLTGQYSGKLTK